MLDTPLPLPCKNGRSSSIFVVNDEQQLILRAFTAFFVSSNCTSFQQARQTHVKLDGNATHSPAFPQHRQAARDALCAPAAAE